MEGRGKIFLRRVNFSSSPPKLANLSMLKNSLEDDVFLDPSTTQDQKHAKGFFTVKIVAHFLIR